MGIVESKIILAVVYIAIFFDIIYKFFDKKRIKDERENLIHLKSLEFMQRVSSAVLAAFAILYIFYPKVNAIYAIIGLSICAIFSYPIGKAFFRNSN